MNKKNIKLNVKQLRIIIVAVVILIVIIAVFAKKNKQETPAEGPQQVGEERTVIQGEKLSEVKNYNGLEISNVRVELVDTSTVIKADIRNTTSQDMDYQWINVNVLDKDGKRITSIGGFISPLGAGETTPLSTSILSNGEDTNAYDIEITKEREIIEPEENKEGYQNT